MKTIRKKIALLIIVGLILSLSSNGCGGTSSGGGGGGGSTTITSLIITNLTAAAVIIGFVSAAAGGACPDLSTLLTAEELFNAGWCTGYEAGVDGAGKCLVTLDAAGSANDSVTVPNPDGKCLSGGFGTGGFAACETATYPNGWTQGEFTLNPTASTQEAVDISLVNGVNHALSIILGTGWFYGSGVTITDVGPNNAIDNNLGMPGIFPNGCTDCIQLVGAPPCPNITSNPTCQHSRICNIYRNNAEGGTVEFRIGELL